MPFTIAEDKVSVSVKDADRNDASPVHVNGNGAVDAMQDSTAVPAAALSTSAAVKDVVLPASPNGNGNGNGAAKAAAPVASTSVPAHAPAPAPAPATKETTLQSLDAVLGTKPEEKPKPAAVAASPATEAAIAAAATVVAASAAGTPYANPGGRWSQFKSYSVFQRTCDIWGFAINFFFRYWKVTQKFSYGKEGMTPERVSAKKRELAVWLREGLVKLGPTFIKIGQQFSTRVDVLSKEFIEELEKLQDDVPAFEWEQAKQILESSLNCRIEDRYATFDNKPIAAASLGQVYLATLKNGEKVVVKVQRPGLKQLFDVSGGGKRREGRGGEGGKICTHELRSCSLCNCACGMSRLYLLILTRILISVF